MELRKAIQRVAKVCPKGKDKALLQRIRFCPATSEIDAYLYATDGLRFSVVFLDTGEDVPNVLLDSNILVKASKEAKSLQLNSTGYGNAEAFTDCTSYKIKGSSFDSFPKLPLIPDRKYFSPFILWDMAAKVFHAADTPKNATEYSVVNFRSGCVEATDRSRLARVYIPCDGLGLIPSSVFQAWPKGDVFISWTAQHVFFMVGDEYRIGAIQHGKYPDTKEAVPEIHPGPKCLVPVAELTNAVCRGYAVSALNLLNVEFTSEQLIIRAWDQGEGKDSYEAIIDLYQHRNDPGRSICVLVNGKYLEQLLKQLGTPNVWVGYGDLPCPLRIDSGRFTGCVWQMVG